MQPTDKFSLLVESQTRGEASINRLNDTLAKLSAVVAATNEKTARSTEASTKRTTDAFKRTESGAHNLGQSISRFLVAPLSSMSDALLSSAAGLGKFGGAAIGAAVGLGGAAIGLKNFTQAASESAREIQSLSLATGLSINQSDKLRAASVLAGFDIRNLKEAALDLSQALKDTSGEGQRVRDLLQKLGVAAYTAEGGTRPLADVLLDTFDALSKIEDVSTRVNLSRVLGGEDAAKSVQPLLAQYAKLNAEAQKLGFGSREALVNSIIEANAEMRKFDLQWEALKGRLASGLTIPLRFINESIQSIGKGPPASRFGAPLGDFAPSAPKGIAESILSFDSPLLNDITAGQRLSDAFRAGQAGTETGIKSRLEKLAQERGVIQQLLSSGNLGATAYQEKFKELKRLESQELQLQTQLKRITERESAIQALPGQIRAERRKLVGPLEAVALERADTKSLIGDQGGKVDELFNLRRLDAAQALALKGAENFNARVKEVVGDLESEIGRQGDFAVKIFSDKLEALIRQQEKEQDQALRLLDIVRTSGADRDERKARFAVTAFGIQSGVGDERNVAFFEEKTRKAFALSRFNEAVRLADFEKDAGEKAIALERARADHAKEKDEAEIERRTKLLQIDRARLDTARGIASDFVGSLQSRNVGGFFRDQGGRLLNQIGTNALAGPVNGLLTRFGEFGAASGFGGLLKGTVFDPQNRAIDANTAATVANTAALTGGGTAGGGFAIPGVPGVTFSDLHRGLKVFGSDTNGITGQGPLSASSLGKFDRSISLGNGRATTLGALIGPAAALSGAAFGAINGFKSGGVQGNLTGAASIAGGAATAIAAGLLGASAAAGPAAPIIAGVGLVLAAAASLIGNPKERRDREINAMLNSSIYNEPTSTIYGIDENGYGFDTGRGGGYRSIVVNISAVDAKSFMDRREDISDAVRQAMIDGHGLNRTAREVVLAA